MLAAGQCWRGRHSWGLIWHPSKPSAKVREWPNITIQNIIGRLLEKIEARRLASVQEDKELLSHTLSSYCNRKDAWMNTALLAADVYEGIERYNCFCAQPLRRLHQSAIWNADERDSWLGQTWCEPLPDPCYVDAVWSCGKESRRRIRRWTSEIEVIAPGLPQG